MPYTVEGEALPTYHLVAAFFGIGHSRLDRGTVGWRHWLETLSIEEHSPSEETLRQSVLLAALITTKRLNLAPYLNDPEAWDAAQLVWQQEQREGLAEIFLGLRRSLGDDERARVEHFVLNDMREAVSIGSTGPMTQEVMALDLKFDDVAFAEVEK